MGSPQEIISILSMDSVFILFFSFMNVAVVNFMNFQHPIKSIPRPTDHALSFPVNHQLPISRSKHKTH